MSFAGIRDFLANMFFRKRVLYRLFYGCRPLQFQWHVVLACGIIGCATVVRAQHWEPVGDFQGFWLNDITNSNQTNLVVGGYVQSVNNELNLNSIAKFDGANFSSFNGNELELQSLSELHQQVQIEFFNDKLYYYGRPGSATTITEMEGDAVSSNYLVNENGTWSNWGIPWDDPENWSNNRTACMTVEGETLWVISYKQGADDPFRFCKVNPENETSCFEIPSPDHPILGTLYGHFTDIVYWNGWYYLSGRFFEIIDSETSIHRHIIKWDGQTTFEHLPQIFEGGQFTDVKDLTVYNDQLIVAGNFTSSESGTPSNHIMTWDGETWGPLFDNGVDEPVYRVKDLEDNLVFSGAFSAVLNEGQPYIASRIAFFDGNSVFRVSEDIIQNEVIDFYVWQDQLYIVGQISALQLEDAGHLARLDEPFPFTTSVADGDDFSFSIYPNPATDLINLEFPDQLVNASVSISDSGGRIKYREEVSGQEHRITGLSAFPPGLYLILITTDAGVFSEKIVLGL